MCFEFGFACMSDVPNSELTGLTGFVFKQNQRANMANTHKHLCGHTLPARTGKCADDSLVFRFNKVYSHVCLKHIIKHDLSAQSCPLISPPGQLWPYRLRDRLQQLILVFAENLVTCFSMLMHFTSPVWENQFLMLLYGSDSWVWDRDSIMEVSLCTSATSWILHAFACMQARACVSSN